MRNNCWLFWNQKMIDVAKHDLETIFSLLSKHVPECEVWAFGSRATWTNKDYSDLDLVVVGSTELKRGRLGKLKEALEESPIPFTVDIMDWNKISPEFQENIKKSFVVIKKSIAPKNNGWHYYKVSDFAEIIGGGTPKTGVPEYWNGNIPWITPKDLSSYQERYIGRGERNITLDGLKNSSAKIIPKNTVLLTSRAPVGYLAIAKNELATNQGFRSLVAKEGFLPEFIYYLLSNKVDYLKQYASGSTFQELSSNTLKNLEFQIPEYRIQKQIAKILGDLDKKIELNNQMNKTLESIAKAIFKKWFIDFEFPGYEKTKFVNGLPEGWKIAQIGSYSTMRNGFAFKGSDFMETGIPVIKIKNIKAGSMIFDDLAYVSREKYEYSEKYTISIGNLLITMSGNRIDGSSDTWVGKVSMFSRQGKYLLNQRVSIIELNPDTKYLRYYFGRLLSSETYQTHFINCATSSGGQANISPDMIKKTNIIIPSELALKAYNSIADAIFRNSCNNEIENDYLLKLRDSILPKLMAGKVAI